MTHVLSIDLETYSEADIKTCGAYRYVEDPSFEILLFAYSVDGSDPYVVDLASGEELPDWIVPALHDPAFVKRAYNAAFEFACLSKVYGAMDPSQWRCSMLHANYCGYPASLEALGAALGLAEDKKKLRTGKDLIRYFCTPCKPTKSNGGRTRNLPKHDPEKWRLFKEYNRQDVVTEMAADDMLSDIPVPDDVQKQWETDLRINSRGVMADMELVDGALAIDSAARTDYVMEAKQLTGLDNPNSVAQLTQWLSERIGAPVDTLRKDDVTALLKRDDLSYEVRRVLELRQLLGKSSTKKYDRLRACVCSDGRVRGLLQFYGANRTGRWAGRLVQVQNLPRTYTKCIEVARACVKHKSRDALSLIYGNVPDTLSQLIRTAFIATPGRVLVDADFSAIEARVISWLAGEQWRIDAFNRGKDIYCESASQMFGVPVEKHGQNGHLRQKGKIAELALGYQGGTGALIAMGALDMGLSEEELPEIVERWRGANSKISALWWEMDAAARQVITEGGAVTVRGRITLAREGYRHLGQAMTIRLPSGRKLYYVDPAIGQNRFGGESIVCKGVSQATKTWGRVETYGGKLTENVVQAIARDCLAVVIERLEALGYPIVFHVHDEVVIDIDTHGEDPAKLLENVCHIMAEPAPWARGLPLDSAGWTGGFFTKD